ncbi:MAG TPA: VacJ family lipoprotein [Ramlibacter sp.]|nr:VacJ family lipoprotein [Ramlibacter sp.]
MLAGVAVLALAGCASPRNPRDPLEPFNRQVMKFNEGVDAVVLKPTATAYKEYVPPLLRTGVSNFFGNLTDAWSAVNSLLQGRVQNAGDNLFRVHVNTLFGMGGVFDVASELNIERHREDLGQTLGRWGVPAGPFIMLPLLGPSTLRDAIALPVDRRFDLIQNVDNGSLRNSIYALRLVDVRSNLLRAGDVLDQAALDKYSFTRDAHLQRRRAEIFETTGDGSDEGSAGEGRPPAEPGAAPAAPAPAAEPGQPPAAPAR